MAYQSIVELASTLVEQLDTTRTNKAHRTAVELERRIQTQLQLNKELELRGRELAALCGSAAAHIENICCPTCRALVAPANYCGACASILRAH
ncbi:MAG: hypothetical protein O7F08_09200 [Deltaproteobacteria bacterium]|nr:hypothetical protein [Deltaproteobacteria bacterium]